jgi:hypothetical protein
LCNENIICLFKFYLKFQSCLQKRDCIKLTGDGVNVPKNGIKLLNFAFYIIDDNENPMSVKETYILSNQFEILFKEFLFLNCFLNLKGIFEIEKENYNKTKFLFFFLI